MMKIGNPDPIFYDGNGAPLFGTILIGQSGQDPQSFPLNTFFDSALTIPAAQPLTVLDGYIVNGATPAPVFIAETDFSMRQIDRYGVTLRYSLSTFSGATQFQPLDTDLSAIAALSTTPFGRNLLLLADQTALRNAVGYPAPLPLAGGTATGDIYRSGNGRVIYHTDPNNSGRVFITGAGAENPMTQIGDIWFEIQ